MEHFTFKGKESQTPKQVFSGGWCWWQEGGHKERVNVVDVFCIHI
jgi:hypothetical protein